jgi:co-chaperonin GroES (HSP10)
MKRLMPTKGRVLLRPDPEQKVINGLTVMETMPAYSTTGEVLEIGEGESPVNVGDRVVYLRTVGRQVVWQGETLLSLGFDELLGVFEDGAKPEPILG